MGICLQLRAIPNCINALFLSLVNGDQGSTWQFSLNTLESANQCKCCWKQSLWLKSYSWGKLSKSKVNKPQYKGCPESIQPHNMKETFIEEDTRYKKHCTYSNDTSVPFKVGTLGPHTVLPITISCPFIFSWISSMVWNVFPFKGDFSFGKS